MAIRIFIVFAILPCGRVSMVLAPSLKSPIGMTSFYLFSSWLVLPLFLSHHCFECLECHCVFSSFSRDRCPSSTLRQKYPLILVSLFLVIFH